MLHFKVVVVEFGFCCWCGSVDPCHETPPLPCPLLSFFPSHLPTGGPELSISVLRERGAYRYTFYTTHKHTHIHHVMTPLVMSVSLRGRFTLLPQMQWRWGGRCGCIWKDGTALRSTGMIFHDRVIIAARLGKGLLHGVQRDGSFYFSTFMPVH